MKTLKTKTVIPFLLMCFLLLNTLQGITQECTNCDGVTTANGGSAIGYQTIATGNSSFASGYLSQALGNLSTAIGHKAISEQIRSVSLGFYAESKGISSFALGNYVTCYSNEGFVIGTGDGSGENERLVNSIPRSLMIGFGSTRPTFFVGDAPSSSSTGRIGIGDMTDPQAKLHVQADEGEQAAIRISPNSFTGNNTARLELANELNGIEAHPTQGLFFNSENDYLFNSGGNVGIGTDSPLAKLQVSNGDIFIEDINKGIIMKSPDGQCWKGQMDNGGNLVFGAIDCNLVTAVKDGFPKEPPSIKVFPNPANKFLTIKVAGDYSGLNAYIYNMAGSLVLAKEIHKAKTKLKTGRLPAGSFFLKVFDKNGGVAFSEKIILLRGQ